MECMRVQNKEMDMRKAYEPPVGYVAQMIGQRIFERRLQRKMTLRELARLTGMSVGYVCDVESGKHSIGVERLLRVSEVFGCTLNDLVTE